MMEINEPVIGFLFKTIPELIEEDINELTPEQVNKILRLNNIDNYENQNICQQLQE